MPTIDRFAQQSRGLQVVSPPGPESIAAPARPTRVCFLIDRLSTAGTESQLLALIRHLDRSRVTPYLCLLDGEDASSRALEPADCPVLRLGVKSLHHLRTIRQAALFRRFLRREQIDVLQVYFPDSTYFGVPIARLAGVRHIVGTRFNLGYWMTPLHRWLGHKGGRASDGDHAQSQILRQQRPAALRRHQHHHQLAAGGRRHRRHQPGGGEAGYHRVARPAGLHPGGGRRGA